MGVGLGGGGWGGGCGEKSTLSGAELSGTLVVAFVSPFGKSDKNTRYFYTLFNFGMFYQCVSTCVIQCICVLKICNTASYLGNLGTFS